MFFLLFSLRIVVPWSLRVAALSTSLPHDMLSEIIEVVVLSINRDSALNVILPVAACRHALPLLLVVCAVLAGAVLASTVLAGAVLASAILTRAILASA